MWVYYQTVEHGRQEWQLIAAAQAEEVRKDAAYHMSIYQLDKLPEVASQADIKYKGDLWIDIDHKPDTDNPTVEEKRAAVQRSILDMQKLMSYFEFIKVDINQCELFATGSKGFHIRVPGKLFGASSPYKSLPRIHKFMAQVISERASIEGLDMQMYAMGKGKLIRVENKQRPNGKYKVYITPAEVNLMTPEGYELITSTPRATPAASTAPGICAELAQLFEEAKYEMAQSDSVQFSTVSSEQLESFADEDPTCVQWLVNRINLKPEDGRFNRGKMSLARYLGAAPLTSDRRQGLISDFFSKWESSRNKASELKAALKFGQEEGFSCQRMTKGFTESPCSKCPVRQQQVRNSAQATDLEVTEHGYCKTVAKGQLVPITNFTLKPKLKHVDSDKVNEFIAFDYAVLEWSDAAVKAVESPDFLTLDAKAWLSASEFRKQIMNRSRLQFIGTDIDLQHLKTYLTSPALEAGVQVVRNVHTVGIYHHVDEGRGINDFVWVEPDWSTNGRLADTVKYMGQRRSSNGTPNTITLNMRAIDTLAPEDSYCLETFEALLKANRKSTVGVLIGWVCSCWLRMHMQVGSDRHLPVLNLFGQAGVGKTETASLFSLLGGADYFGSRPLVVSGSTPYAIVAEGTMTTTVPRILDELNAHKIAERKRYMTAVEVIKASATGGGMSQGALGNGARSSTGAIIEERPITTPLIFLGTNPTNVMELRERTVEVDMSWRGEEEKDEYAPYFEQARQDAPALWPIAKALMQSALKIRQPDVKTWMTENRKLLPKIGYRNQKNWQVTLTGIDFLVHTLEAHSIPEYIVQQVRDLKPAVIEKLVEDVEQTRGEVAVTEVDNVLNDIANLASIMDFHGNTVLKAGLHYQVEGTALHLFATAAFVFYVKSKREAGQSPEMADVSQFRLLLSRQPYFLGEGIAPNVSNPRDWFSFDLAELRKRGVNVDRFSK